MKTGLVAAGALALGPRFYEDAFAATAVPGPGPYGPPGPIDPATGLMLPEGFSSRVIARGTQPVAGSGYPWPVFPDGAATFKTPDGGWILTVNSEFPTPFHLPDIPVVGFPAEGGASAIRFDPDGAIIDAYRILGNTSTNCAGGPTPWGTWLSCEETETGMVWECDPTGKREAVVHPALGVFTHEAVCVDPRRGHAYLSEDDGEGGFYRFTPERKGDLSVGLLEIAKLRRDGTVRWLPLPDPSAASAPTRQQVKGSTRFERGEGIWYDRGHVYLATTRDGRIWRYSVTKQRMKPIYDPATLISPPLTDVDNITVSRSGDIFVCEDNGAPDAFDIGIITSGRRLVNRFLTMTGPEHGAPDTSLASEVAGVCFDPSGQRMYLSSQRGGGHGITYEVSGPFRTERPRRIKPK